MPTVDAYGQSVSIAALADAPNANTLASNIVTPVVPRTVMRFASASARNATLTSPVAGMVVFLVDSKLFTGYDGTAWVVMAAGSQTWTTIGLAAGYVHDGNSNGSVQYRLVNLFGESWLQLRGAVAVTYSAGIIPNSGTINAVAMPAAARPTSLRTIVIPCSDVGSERITLKLDVRTDGLLRIYGSTPTNAPVWIGFNGVSLSL